MKQLFRFLTAEANGFYLRAINDFLNEYATAIQSYLTYAYAVQFKTEAEEIRANEIPMLDNDIIGIAKTAGVFQPYLTAESNAGSILFTASNIVGGVQFSERGLYEINKEVFKFFRTTLDNYPTDITTLATTSLRASFIPEGAPILGYIAEDTIVLTNDGHIIYENILAEPPVDKAYIPFYGEKYLFMAENFVVAAYLDIDTFKAMFEAYQRIRYNGASIAELASVTELLMEDYVYDIHFTSNGSNVIMGYKINEASELYGKIKRTFIWLDLIRRKFKQISPTEELP